jgi:hypothetical protein
MPRPTIGPPMSSCAAATPATAPTADGGSRRERGSRHRVAATTPDTCWRGRIGCRRGGRPEARGCSHSRPSPTTSSRADRDLQTSSPGDAATGTPPARSRRLHPDTSLPAGRELPDLTRTKSAAPSPGCLSQARSQSGSLDEQTIEATMAPAHAGGRHSRPFGDAHYNVDQRPAIGRGRRHRKRRVGVRYGGTPPASCAARIAGCRLRRSAFPSFTGANWLRLIRSVASGERSPAWPPSVPTLRRPPVARTRSAPDAADIAIVDAVVKHETAELECRRSLGYVTGASGSFRPSRSRRPW